MGNEFYTIILHILYSISLFSGILMFFFPSEKKKKFVTYKRSRYIVGVIFVFYAILCFIHSNFELRTTDKLHASALSLSVYYISAILFGYSLIPLLNKTYCNRRRIITDSFRYLLFLCFIAATFVLNTPYSEYALMISAAYFFFDSLRIVIVFIKNYRICINDIDNFHSTYNVDSYVKWMFKVTISLIVYGLSFVFVVYASKTLVGLFSCLGIFLIIYIVISFNNYLMYIEKINLSQHDDVSDTKESHSNVNDSISYSEIKNKLQIWISEEKFLKEGITIMTLCAELNTNRTYISQYINTTYNCSFRDFIAGLRITKAKKMLHDDQTKDISEIAICTGFSSTRNLYRSFKKIDNTTPVKYRKNALSHHKEAVMNN